MIKRIFKYFLGIRFEFIKYFVIGVSAVILDMMSLVLFKEIFGLQPVMAVVINQFFLLVYVFCLNKYWTFRDKTMPKRQVVRFLILVFFNYIIAVSVMYIFNQWLEFDYRLVRLGTIALAVSWNFLLYKYWVYKQ